MDKNDIHEIVMEGYKTVEVALDKVNASTEKARQYLEDLQSDSYTSPRMPLEESQKILQKKAEEYKKDIANFTNEAIEERTYSTEWHTETPPKTKTSFQKQKREIPKVDLEVLKRRLGTFTMKKSVVKTFASNVRRNKKIKKIAFGTSFVLFGLVAGIRFGPQVTKWVEVQEILADAMDTYEDTIYSDNRYDGGVKEDKRGQMQPQINYFEHNMLVDLDQKYEGDSLVVWYFYYLKFLNSGEEVVLNRMDKIVKFYNDFYGTDYKDMDDFLVKNGFKDKQEYREYVALQEKALQERTSRGV